MTLHDLKAEAKRLSLDERIELLNELWETIEQDPDSFPLTPEQEAELDRRLDDYEARPTEGAPWEEVMARIRASHHPRIDHPAAGGEVETCVHQGEVCRPAAP